MAAAGWGTFLAGIAGPIAKRVLAALGMGTLTLVGLQAAISAALDATRSSLGGMTGVVADLVAMSGFFSAAAIIAGGLTTAVTMVALKRLAVLT